MKEPIVKPTTRGDIPALQAVLDQTGLFPGDMLPDMAAPALTGQSPALWLTCHLGGAPVGLSYTVPEAFADGTWNMLALAVRPDLQCRGLGSALVAAAEQHLRAGNQRLLIVDTSGTAAFARARQFYARQGYKEAARIRDFWAAGDDKVTFRKAL
ncbi:GNAT family N-acetyltransferase [uncultured Roseobacter sp.]|uniref:GNAT family N-acetyltransferase n=1 Tax=uncultured Roseobacter sp. TaxID=114847 RepID=UPI00261A0592|nr:GNAT family N-acetyltransferase [uncultured Roseobacter sp.]